MKISERFLQLVRQQLISFETDSSVKHLVVYIAQSKDGESPSLEVVGQWPILEKTLQPLEADKELRAPSQNRRWYPLQEGSILLGVLRVERSDSDESWPEALDRRLQASAAALAHCLGLELERENLLNELGQQREQIGLMVHQLRNPLAALRTYAKLLLRRLGAESNHRSLLQGLLNEQEQLNRYISALDELSQVKLPVGETGPIRLLLPPVVSQGSSLNLSLLIEPLIDRALVTANLQGREWIGPSNKWPDWIKQPRSRDEGVVAEIIANLLENAFRYSEKSSPIGLSFDDYKICVWDGGEPIEKEEREKIFKKGFRGKNSLEMSGTGLGLGLARQLAHKIGGELLLLNKPSEFNSQMPSKGNAFVLNLPKESMIEE
tara:strand:+ start:38163 stop:39296 length:1134 start_codon:yes stop_codon:yes gene_type:complete